jgi:beta-lactamase class A
VPERNVEVTPYAVTGQRAVRAFRRPGRRRSATTGASAAAATTAANMPCRSTEIGSMRRPAVLPLALFALPLGAALSCTAQPAPPLPAPVPVRAEDVRPAQAFASDLAALERSVRSRLAGEPGDYGIVAIDIETGRSFGINETLELHAASTMKLAVLLELYRRAAAGDIRLDDPVPVRNLFRSIADRSEYALSPDGDSEQALYHMVGGQTTFRELARRMSINSSNLATNILVDTLRAPRVQQTVLRVGGAGMHVRRGVEDGAAFRAGVSNTTSARALANVLASIARCDILPPAHCDELTALLAAHEFNELIPAGLPAGSRVAHVTGWITGIQHDGGIVMPLNSPPFVLVVLSRGAADTLAARRVAADVARLAWAALGPGGSLRPHWPPYTAELLALHERVRLPAFPAPRLGHDELWSALAPVIDGAQALHRERIGRSAGGRPLQLVRFGAGDARVLLWSQMHGDETTASRALADIFHFIASQPDDPRVRRWAERLTILAVPMLNPDGADAHRRRGAFGIDINRDARVLATPEGRALKAVQERWQPHFGFNLHDQNPRARVGASSRIAAMALLAPAPDDAATPTPSFVRAQRLTAYLARELAPLVGDHLTRYDDSYNARAFGDGMQSWGVSTVLIETGSWRRDESKHYLRRTNFIALAAALDAIADASYEDVDVALYTSLPRNGRAVNDLLIHGGSIVLSGEPYRGDIAIDAPAVGGPAIVQAADIGDLLGVEARDTIDATGLYLHPELEVARRGELQPGPGATSFVIRSGAAAASDAVWVVDGTSVRQFGPADNQPAGPPPPLVGCYRIEPGPWRGLGDYRSDSEHLRYPDTVRLHWRYAIDALPATAQRLLATDALGAMPLPYRSASWRPLEGGELDIRFSTGLAGLELTVAPAGSDLAGTVRLYAGATGSGEPRPTADVRLRRVTCGSAG